MAKILFFVSFFIGLAGSYTLAADRSFQGDDVWFFIIATGIILLFLALAWRDTRNRPKFLGLSFGGWVFGFVLSFIVGAVCGFFV